MLTPPEIPYAYRGKLEAEVRFLQNLIFNQKGNPMTRYRVYYLMPKERSMPVVFSWEPGPTEALDHRDIMQLAVDSEAVAESGDYVVTRSCSDLSGSARRFHVELGRPVIT